MPVNYTNPTNTTPANLEKLKAIAVSVGEEITNIEVHEPKLLEYKLTYDVVNPNHTAICKPDALNRFLYLAHVAITYGCLETPLNELTYDEANLRANLLCAYYALHTTLNYDEEYCDGKGLVKVATQIAMFTNKSVTVEHADSAMVISDNDAVVLNKRLTESHSDYQPFLAVEANLVNGKISSAFNLLRAMSDVTPQHLFKLYGYKNTTGRFFNTRSKRLDAVTLNESFVVEMLGYLHVIGIIDSSLEWRCEETAISNWSLLPSCELPIASTVKDKTLLDLLDDKSLAPFEQARVALYEKTKATLGDASHCVINKEGNLLIPYGLVLHTTIVNGLLTYEDAVDDIINRLGVDIETMTSPMPYTLTTVDSISKVLDRWYDNPVYSNQYNHLFIEIDLEERKTNKRSL